MNVLHLKEITVDDLLKQNDGTLIDVREVEEYAHGHIPNSENIPMIGLLMNPTSFIQKNKKYYVICAGGGRSMQVCYALQNEGYNVVNVLGGTEEYLKKR